MKHPAFDIKNPNRVRALVGAFTGNHLRFHAADGAGYRAGGRGDPRRSTRINPQVAARMAGAFESWRRYDASAPGADARANWKRSSSCPGISPNLFEVASKMLG